MSFTDHYQPAAFRWGNFLVPSNGMQGGRLIIEHIYPDSDRHYMEDNGKQPVRYSIDGIVVGSNGTSVVDEFLALKSALEAPGPGTLLHPWLGATYVAVNGYDASESQSRAGVIDVRMDFIETDAPSFPSAVTGSGSVISPLTSTALRALADAFLAEYPNPLSSFSSLRTGEVLNSITESVDDVFQSAEGMNELVKDLTSNVSAYLPDQLTENLFNMYAAPVRDESVTTDVLYNGWKKVSRKSTDLTALNTDFDVTTIDLETRAKTLAAFRSAHYSAALICFCESTSYRDYVAADQASRDQRFIIDKQTSILKHIHPEARESVTKVITATLEYLRSIEVQLPKIETLRLTDWPVVPLAYQLYDADVSKIDVLIGLNQDANLMLYEQSAEVLRGGK